MSIYKSILISVVILLLMPSVASAVNPWDVACEGNYEAGTTDYTTVYTTVGDGLNNRILEVNPQWSEDSSGVGRICDSSQIANPEGIVTYTLYMDSYYPSFWSFAWDCGECYHDISPNPVGASATWNKQTYSPGEIATVTFNVNSQFYDGNNYRYTARILNPVTGYYEVYPMSSYTKSVQVTMVDVGTYETSILVTQKDTFHGQPAMSQSINVGTSIVSNGQLISFIKWNSANYGLGEIGKISYGVSNSYQDYLYTYSVEVYKGNVLVKTYDDLVNIGQLDYTFSTAGQYTAKLIRYNIIYSEVLKTATITINEPASTINTDKTSYNTTETVKVTGFKYPASGEKPYYYVIISHGQSVTGIVNSAKIDGIYPYSFALEYNLPVGSYYASLYGTSSLNDCAVVDNTICLKLKDYKQFTVTSPNNPTTGHPNLDISWGAPQYKLWETAHFSYQNATYNDTVKIHDNFWNVVYQFRVNDQGIGTLYSGTVQIGSDPKYIGIWNARIINGSNSADYKTVPMTVISASQANFSNDYGITMNWDSPVGSPGKHVLTWNTGVYSGTYDIKLIDGISGNFIMTLPFTTTSIKANQYTFTLNTQHESYTAQFINTTGVIQASASIEISNLGSPGVTVPGGNSINLNSGGDELIQTSGTLLSAVGNVGFYGLIIWLGIIGVTIRQMTSNGGSVNGQAVIIIAWLSCVMIALIGLFGDYKIYIIVLSTIIAAIMFRVGQNTSVGQG